MARKLGRTPTQRDWRANYRALELRSLLYYVRCFGTFEEAVKAAGLPAVRKQEFTREELIDQLRNLSRALDRKLMPPDVSEARRRHTCANVRTFRRAFGSVPNALIAAGVYRTQRIANAELLAGLKKLAAKTGRPLTTVEVDAACKKGICASSSCYLIRFGSFAEAMRQAGLEYLPPKFSREELLAYLHQFYSEFGRTPTYREVKARSAEGLMPSMMNYSRRFGGLHAALREAGLEAPLPGEAVAGLDAADPRDD